MRLAIRFIFCWLLYFAVWRWVFVFWHWPSFEGAAFQELLQIFYFGLRQDLSMAGYFFILPFLVGTILYTLSLPSKVWKVFLVIYQDTLIVITSFLNVVDLNIYREWGNKLNYRAVEIFFNFPRESIISSLSSPIFISIVIFSLMVVIGFSLGHFILRDISISSLKKRWGGVVFLLVSIGLFIMIRGGLGVATMNQSAVYFSNKHVLNHAALNTEWNLLHNIWKTRNNTTHPHMEYAQDEAREVVDNILKPPAYSPGKPMVLLERPNVILIILESFSAGLMKALGGEVEGVPFLDRLSTQSVFFENFYATGDRTDKGLIGILSGFPSQESQSIITIPEKNEKLPSIIKSLKREGYATSFVYGGDAAFFNIKSFLLSQGTDKLIDGNFFQRNEKNSKWGAHDGVVLDFLVDFLDKESPPFFSTFLTLSNHEPFEVPGESYFSGDDLQSKFRSTAYYTDKSLEDFFKKAQQREWYPNTLFVLVADHGHYLPENLTNRLIPERFHIPMLFFGNPIAEAWRGKRVSEVGSQTDIAKTLLAQLGMRANEFEFGRDLLSSEHTGFAFFSYVGGFGVVEDGCKLVYDVNMKKTIFETSCDNTEETLKKGKAFMQIVYQKFLDL
ncbi:MAG: LTA synthase family protein [Cystobacterineae bacterium]|nr:LTA synthase family protein [Cystobacterineae bacterium]